MADVTMPQLGETVTEGTITQWFKQVGEEVAEDEVLFEVSTDKVDSEVPSPVGGVLTEIRAAEGDVVEVGQVLAVVADAADAPADIAAPGSAEVVSGPAPAPAPVPTEAGTPEPPPPAPVETASVAPAAPPPAPVETAAVAPPPAAEAPPAPVAPAVVAAPDAEALPLSPVVRRLINDSGIDPATVPGTGLGGRITRRDVENAIAAQGLSTGGGPVETPAPPVGPEAVVAAPTAPMPAASGAESSPEVAAGGDSTIPMSNIRRRTAEHMVMSKAVSPHVLTAVEVDFENVEQVRRAARAEWKAEEGFSLTYLPFIARAVCDAIHEFPHVNASVTEDQLVIHNDVHLGIAVDLDFQGLLAPVVKGADGKRLRTIAREIVDLAQRARSKHLNADEIMGGTFTITNPGQYGTLMQFPIINQPQVAILSTDGIRRRPVVVTDPLGNESIGIHSVGVLALAWDHRAFDGAYVAAFLDHVREILETRDWEAEL